MANTITGRVHRITPEQQITGKSGKTFIKRTLVLDASRFDPYTGEKKFDNYPSIEFSGDIMKTLDGFNEGDVVVVSFDINGREFNDEQTGEIKYFNSVRGYRIERYRTGESAPAQITDNDPQPSLHEQGRPEEQLPF